MGGGGKEGRWGTVASELVPVPHVSNNMLECGNLELTIGDSPGRIEVLFYHASSPQLSHLLIAGLQDYEERKCELVDHG